MSNIHHHAINDLYSTISFGGGGSSGGSGGSGRATLGPGGGSDPGNFGYPNRSTSSGPLSPAQRNVITIGSIGVTSSPVPMAVRFGFGLLGAQTSGAFWGGGK